MDSAGDLTAAVKSLAVKAGFARVGIAQAGEVRGRKAFRHWLEAGYNGRMDYLARNLEKRFRPELLAAGTRSVICLAVSYAPAASPPPESAGFVARYARGRDYHDILKRRCRNLMRSIAGIAPDFVARAFVDSAPVAERSLAAAAGLGWIGRNGCLLCPGLGSYVVLAEIVCNLPLVADAPLEAGCGDCHACVDACPAGALLDDGLMDARRCLSYLSIEHRGCVEPELWPLWGGRLFGCDRCQEVCPHNRDVQPGDDELLGDALGDVSIADVLNWSRGDWDAATRGSAMRRATFEMFLRNAIIVAGNSPDASLRDVLKSLRRRHPQFRDILDRAIGRAANDGV